MERTILIVFGGMTRGSALGATVDVVVASAALRAVAAACGSGFLVAAPEVGCIARTLELLFDADPAPRVRKLENDRETLEFARTGAVSAVVLMGGDERVLELFDAVHAACPSATIMPIASTGGAARAVFDREPGTYDSDLVDYFPRTSAIRRMFESAPPTPWRPSADRLPDALAVLADTR